jgi:Zn-dependent oligopeptidase
VRRDTVSLDLEAVRQYFPLQYTVDAVLDILHTIFGVDFEGVRATDAWAPGVLEYEITDSATHALLGTTYFDVYARAHKHGHLESVLILPVRVVNGVRRPAVAAILGN